MKSTVISIRLTQLYALTVTELSSCENLQHSLVVEIINPKTALFFLTFLPQFVDPSATIPVGLQFLILGLIVNLVFSMADLAAVGIASLAVGRLMGGGAGWMVPKTCGTILIGLGVALVSHHV